MVAWTYESEGPSVTGELGVTGQDRWHAIMMCPGAEATDDRKRITAHTMDIENGGN